MMLRTCITLGDVFIKVGMGVLGEMDVALTFSSGHCRLVDRVVLDQS